MDWNMLAAMGAIVTAAVAAWQLWRIRVDALDARAAEIASVSVITTVLERPTVEVNRAGHGLWIYEFTVHNPGRLPISDVRATVTFPCVVERRHYDGTIDRPTRDLHLRTPVIAPGGSHIRRRSLLIDEHNRSRLDNASARVTFYTADAGEQTTLWPPAPANGSSSLRRRLRRPHR